MIWHFILFHSQVTAGIGLLIKKSCFLNFSIYFFWTAVLQERFVILSGFDKLDNLSL
jgi:hypothetical protein